MTDFAYEEGRWEPPIARDEDATLLGFLERQRATFAWKSGELDAAGLRATLGRVIASNWSICSGREARASISSTSAQSSAE